MATDKIILHCDLNNFFASVSLLTNPTLYDVPMAVCGSAEERHGIVLAKNELAKSRGVRTAEAVWEAKAKCPGLVTVAPDYASYCKYSDAVRAIYARYTDLIEPFSIDECWLDVTGSTLLFGSGEQIAERIRREVREELGITVSVGVSFNKIFAKLGSDLKKPDAVTVISRENYREKVWPLPVSALLFVGRNTEARLRESGVFTIGDLTCCADAMLDRLLGKTGRQLKDYALGEDRSPVTPPRAGDRPKSIGRSVTPPADIRTPEEVWQIFLSLAEDISRHLRRYGLYAGGIQVHTRTSALEVREYSRTLAVPVSTSLQLAKKGMALFGDNYRWALPLRSVGLRAVSLRDDTFAVQQDLFGTTERDEQEEKLENSMESVREKFGRKSIGRGRSLKSPDCTDPRRPGN